MEKFKLDDIKEYSEKETLVKSWELAIKKKTNNTERVSKVSKITLTEQRLIVSDGKYNSLSQSYKRTSYPLSSIKSTYVQIGRDSEQKPIWPIVVLGIMTLLFLCVGAFLTPIVKYLGIFFLIMGVLLLAKTVHELLKNQEQTFACVIIKLEITGESEIKTIVNSCDSLYGTTANKGSTITLKFTVTKESVEMAKELDNLIVDTKIKKKLI